jgi:hypothetical protein
LQPIFAKNFQKRSKIKFFPMTVNGTGIAHLPCPMRKLLPFRAWVCGAKKDIATVGKSMMGWFYGFNLTIVSIFHFM